MTISQRWNMLTSRIAALYQQGSQGWFLEAARVAEETVDFAEREFGADHPNTAESLESLALIRHAQGKYVERLLFEQKLVDGEENLIIADDPAFQYPLNYRVLSNLARRKFTEAEHLFKKALAIKDKIYQPDHPDVLRSIGNLAEVYSSQGKYSEAESLFRLIRIHSTLEDGHTTSPEMNGKDSFAVRPHRRDPRFRGKFPAEITVGEVGGPSLKGMTENISEHGALIKLKDCSACKINDQVTLTIFVPPLLSDQDKEIGMQGMAHVTRIDEDNEVIALQFAKSFAQFERIEELDIAGRSRYKKLAYYLSLLEELPLAEFEKNHPNGFLVERVQSILDSDVIFQFSTQQVEAGDSFYQLDKNAFQAELLQARVIEVNKRKTTESSNLITIGRAASNDIIIYNRMVSKSHCQLCITLPHDACYLIDIGSTNGTFLNNNKLQPHEKYKLADADEISFGLETKLIYFSAKGLYTVLSELKSSG